MTADFTIFYNTHVLFLYVILIIYSQCSSCDSTHPKHRPPYSVVNYVIITCDGLVHERCECFLLHINFVDLDFFIFLNSKPHTILTKTKGNT